MSLCIIGEPCVSNLWLELAPLLVILIAFAITWWWLEHLIRVKEVRK